MEAPILDDTMDMASPYQGPVDDFEIDLDAMEDQASNTDRDMTVADDEQYVPSAAYNQHAADDTDMADDFVESADMDAEHENPDTADQGYGEQGVYETDMADEDYDEDIDAPIPSTGTGDMLTISKDEIYQISKSKMQMADENNLVEENRHESVDSTTDVSKGEIDEHYHDSQDASERQNNSANGDASEEIENPRTELTKLEGGIREANSVGRSGLRLPRTGRDEIGHIDELDSDGCGISADTKPSTGELKDQDVQVENNRSLDGPSDGETDAFHETVPLHPLKVYYQDNEISLFPPREGDSSDMFLLEDESLAYGDCEKLLSSCREVLREGIGENELLVINIESLNIQLTEESPCLRQVTLYQIVDLYIRLCHNEGIADAEPLYLTLSTKLTISAQISCLIEYISEGKGLSDIQPWDEYDTAVHVSTETDTSQTDQKLSHVPLEPETTPPSNRQRTSDGAKPLSQIQVPQEEMTVQEADGYEELSTYEANDATSALENKEVEHDYEGKEPGTSVSEPSSRGASLPPEVYDSEAQNTESTVAITRQLRDERRSNEPASVPLNGQAAPDVYTEHNDAEAAEYQYDHATGGADDERDDGDSVAEGEYYDSGSIASHGDHHAYEDAWSGDYGDSEKKTEKVDVGTTDRPGGSVHEMDKAVAAIENSSSQPDEGWLNNTAEDDKGHFVEEADKDNAASGSASEPEEANILEDGSHATAGDSPKLTDDLLSLPEDVGIPVEGTTHTDGQVADQLEQGELRDATEDMSRSFPYYDVDFALDHQDLAGPGYGITLGADTADSTANSMPGISINASIKRTRESEGVSEANEIKRRRSS